MKIHHLLEKDAQTKNGVDYVKLQKKRPHTYSCQLEPIPEDGVFSNMEKKKPLDYSNSRIWRMA